MADGGDPAAGRQLWVFLSYFRTDLERARPVIALREAAGIDPWWDGMLEGGENYLATTENRLETADCVAVLWSQASVASHWVRDEAQRGHERGCLVPLSLDGTMALLGFRQFPLLDISGWPGDPDDALAAIANTASSAGEVRTLYSQAIAAARHAIALEGRLAQGHLALGFALNNGELKRAEAMVHYRAAEKLAPGDADALRQVATFYSSDTERDVASQMIARVIELDPLNARAYRSAGFIALFARDYSAAISQMRRARRPPPRPSGCRNSPSP